MAVRPKLLLLDDDPQILELYQDMLARLPSQPEIYTATSGARALSLLESQPFTLLISDLNMPKMDGLQVLTIVRHKYPDLRTAVMTSMVDEQFRARSYAVGVDLYLEKPQNNQEVAFFVDCIESLLRREQASGFRGVQSKSLVDLIQLECLSKNSSVLKITNGPVEARIWLENGDVIDAAAQDLTGERAFQKILSWRTGTFEILPAEPSRPRAIHTSYQGLLLESAQVLDEKEAGEGPNLAGAQAEDDSPVAEIARHRGVEFVLDYGDAPQAWGLDNPKPLLEWSQKTWREFAHLGERWQAGALQRIESFGSQRHLILGAAGARRLGVGYIAGCARDQARQIFKKIADKWAS